MDVVFDGELFGNLHEVSHMFAGRDAFAFEEIAGNEWRVVDDAVDMVSKMMFLLSGKVEKVFCIGTWKCCSDNVDA